MPGEGCHFFIRKTWFRRKIIVRLYRDNKPVEVNEYDKKILWEADLLAREINTQKDKEQQEDERIRGRLAALA
jgi:hypothetical protein